MKNIILLAGPPATGKTSFSEHISSELKIPCFNKDYIKVILGEKVGFANRKENLNLSFLTFDLMEHVAECFFKQQAPIILESNFRENEGERLKQLIDKYKYKSLTYLFSSELKTLHKRFLIRDESAERHWVHKSNSLNDFSVFENTVTPLLKFNPGGKIVNVDTTDFSKVDYAALLKIAKDFFE